MHYSGKFSIIRPNYLCTTRVNFRSFARIRHKTTVHTAVRCSKWDAVQTESTNLKRVVHFRQLLLQQPLDQVTKGGLPVGVRVVGRRPEEPRRLFEPEQNCARLGAPVTRDSAAGTASVFRTIVRRAVAGSVPDLLASGSAARHEKRASRAVERSRRFRPLLRSDAAVQQPFEFRGHWRVFGNEPQTRPVPTGKLSKSFHSPPNYKTATLDTI